MFFNLRCLFSPKPLSRRYDKKTYNGKFAKTKNAFSIRLQEILTCHRVHFKESQNHIMKRIVFSQTKTEKNAGHCWSNHSRNDGLKSFSHNFSSHAHFYIWFSFSASNGFRLIGAKSEKKKTFYTCIQMWLISKE